MRKYSAVILSVLLPVLFQYSTSTSHTTIDWSGELRLRSEFDARSFDSGSPVNTYTLSRARLGADIRPAENISLFLQVQDSRVFGKAPNTLSSTSNLDLHQGYFAIRGFLSEIIDLKAGRMEISYGNERLIGSVGWQPVGHG